jgi:hypothetical protein
LEKAEILAQEAEATLTAATTPTYDQKKAVLDTRAAYKQIINDDFGKFGDKVPADKKTEAEELAKYRPYFMGPSAGTALHEVVVGAWHVGTVLDTAASRGSGRGFASHKYDSAANVNVDVQWWSGDRLFKHFANRPGTGQDFRTRSAPVIGYTNNKEGAAEPSVFEVKTDVGPDGSSVGTPGTIAEHLKDKGWISANADVTRSVMAAQTTCPDPWDLPACAPVLPFSNESNPDRKDFLSVGQERGSRHEWVNNKIIIATNEIHFPTHYGRDGHWILSGSLMDPGNKFAASSSPHAVMVNTDWYKGDRTRTWQGSVVAHVVE